MQGTGAVDGENEPEVGPVEEGDELRGEERQHQIGAQRAHRVVHGADDIAIGFDRAGADTVGKSAAKSQGEQERHQIAEGKRPYHEVGVSRVAQKSIGGNDSGDEHHRTDHREYHGKPETPFLGGFEGLERFRFHRALVGPQTRFDDTVRDPRPDEDHHEGGNEDEVVVGQSGDFVGRIN